MSDVHGLISHKSGYYYITLEEDYVELYKTSAIARFERGEQTEEKEKERDLRIAHAVAKAYITSVLEQLSNQIFKATGKDRDIWVFLSFPELERRLHGGCKMRVLKTAMKELTEDGYVYSRPNKNPRYRAKEYKLNHKKVQKDIDLLPRRIDDDDSADMHDDSADMHDDSADMHDDSADMHTRINTDRKRRINREKERDTAQSPNGDVCSSSSPSPVSTHKGSRPRPTDPPKEEKKQRRKAKGMTDTEIAVIEKWDSLHACPIDRTDRDVKAAASYFARMIDQGHITLDILPQVRTKILENPFWQNNLTFPQFKRLFSTHLTSLKVTYQEDTDTSSENASKRYEDPNFDPRMLSNTESIEYNAWLNAHQPAS